MRREALAHATSKIVSDLKASGVAEALSEFLESARHSHQADKKSNGRFPINVIRSYAIATHDYTELQRRLCKILDIDSLVDGQFWEAATNELNPPFIFKMLQNIRFAVDQLPKLLVLLEQDYVEEVKRQSEDLPQHLKGKALL